MYTIYHIPDFIWSDGTIGKIGCSINPDIRVKKQGYNNYKVLEEHIDIYIASDREIALQKQYGLPVDRIPYSKASKLKTEIGSFKGGKTQGKNNIDSGHIINLRNKNMQSNHFYNLGITAGNLLYKEKRGIFAMSKEERVEASIKGGKLSGTWKIVNSIYHECPHCNKIIKGYGNYGRWHGENCKAKPQ